VPLKDSSKCQCLQGLHGISGKQGYRLFLSEKYVCGYGRGNVSVFMCDVNPALISGFIRLFPLRIFL
jgi:hypothetical protein